MRVNPFYSFNIGSSIDSSNALIQELTEELSTGVRVNQLSDDPIAAAQNEQLMAQLSRDDTFTQTTAPGAEGLLNVTDSTLGNVVSEITEAISSATEGNNGTNSGDQLNSIVQQLTGIRNEIVSLANTSYLGQYIFSGGGQSGTPAFSTNGDYQGASNTISLTTPNGQTINLNIPGSAIFGSTTSNSGLLGTLNSLINDFSQASTAGSISGQSSAIGSLITTLTSDLNNVSSQRVTLDNSLSQLQAAESSASSEATQLLQQQTNLVQADFPTIAAKLNTAESQETALSDLLAGVGKETLFDFLQQ
jgi:flagellar hook-associated protein 3 FlgL